MRLGVTFKEQNSAFGVNFEEQNKSLDVAFKGTQIIQVTEDVYVKVTQTEDGVLLEATDSTGNTSAVIANGKDGYTPVKGVDYFDGKNGEDGRDGKDGYTPIKGIDYFDGKDGRTPVKGVDYFDGVDGKDGYTPVKNVDYFDGDDGYTPQKGVDYWTEADKREMAQYAKDSIVIPDVPTKVSAFDNDAGYLTEHQDLSDYAKHSDIPKFKYEEWIFELEDGSTVTKMVVIG